MSITEQEIEAYRKKLIKILLTQQATDAEIALITDEMIINAISLDRDPRAVAWALLQ